MMFVRMTREPCDACPWKGRLELRPGRLVDLRDETRSMDGVFVCHKLLDTRRGTWTVGPQATGAICSGWREAQHSRGGDWAPWEVQVAERLGLVTWVDV